MINKDEITDIKRTIDCLQESINKLEEQKFNKARELLDKTLSCPEIINEAEWAFTSDNCLVSDTRKHKLLSTTLQTTYHCNFENDLVRLFFDDWDITIVFEKPGALIEFIKNTMYYLKPNL